MAPPAPGRWRRRFALGGMAAAILLAHGWGLRHIGRAAAADVEQPARPGAFTVRTLPQPAGQPLATTAATPALMQPVPWPVVLPVALPLQAPAPAPAREPVRKPVQVTPAEPAAPAEAAVDAPEAPAAGGTDPAFEPPALPEEPSAEPDADSDAQPDAEAGAEPDTEAPADPSTPAGAEPLLLMAAAAPAPGKPVPRPDTVEVPVYPTRLAAAFNARYRLQRGVLGGVGTLRWAPSSDGRRYEARLDGSVAGFNVLDWTSTGAIDRAGVAPERFLVRRRGRDAQAANFQRGPGKITYSGPSVQYDLPTGAQDRLSWMLQIGGVLNAAPKRFGVGSRLSFFVSGARGDADLWHFNVIGLESVPAGGAGSTMALKLVREPRKAFDTHVEVWLDPAREHRPVLARLSTSGKDDALELRLAD